MKIPIIASLTVLSFLGIAQFGWYSPREHREAARQQLLTKYNSDLKRAEANRDKYCPSYGDHERARLCEIAIRDTDTLTDIIGRLDQN